MATAAMPPRSASAARLPRETTPREIIASARTAPAGFAAALCAAGASSLLMWAAFTPVDFGPLGWVCLAPLLTLARLARPPRKMYRAAFLGGLIFWLPALQWMRLGDPTMYGAWAALSIYLALYFPLFLALTRVAVWRYGVPLVAAAPVVWTGLELLRGHLMSGFSWYYLGHTQYRWIELIQISDIVGTYGVSFLLALSAACLAELIPAPWLGRAGLLPAGHDADSVNAVGPRGQVIRVCCVMTLLAACLGYGYWRRNEVEFAAGPRIALIQSNVTSEVKHDPGDWPRIQQQIEHLTSLAVEQQPDLIVWPETMFRWPLVETPADVTDEALQQAHPDLPISWLRGLPVRRKLATLSEMAGAGMVIGLEVRDIDLGSRRTYNSAVFVKPDGKIAGRYDKLHRVPFGEFIPLADSLPWLHRLTPFSADFGIDAGVSASVFRYKDYRFAPIICFEDTVPQLVRNILDVTSERVGEDKKPVDFLVNLTNDGWFHGSSELDQHLITAAFRCVEFRTPMVRAVNTGISAFIDGDGVIRQRAEGIKFNRPKQDEAVVVDMLPLDPRASLYLSYGDWFSGSCLVVCSFLGMTGLAGRWLGPARCRPVAATPCRDGSH